MTITIERAPIVTASFLEQPCLDSEFFRKFKPDGDRYSNDDDLGHNNYHLGFDFGRRGRPDTLIAVTEGIVEHIDVDFTGAFGKQIGLRTKASNYKEAAFYAHCETRIDDGTRVLAGRSIGRMGTTGNVPEHLHFSWLADWRSRNKWRNPGPALRLLQYRLTHPTTPPPGQEEEMTEAEWDRLEKLVDKLTTEKAQQVAAYIVAGTRSDTFPNELPWTTRDPYVLAKIMQKLNQP